jgi:nucleotide-binding universal stress UspA family protein
MKDVRRILLATDNSEGANRALDTAANLAKHFGAELIIVTVEQGFFDPELGRVPTGDTFEDILEARAREILRRAKERAQQIGAERIKTVSGLGDAVAFIVDVAKSESVDLIVLGKRGRSRLAGILLGSVSQRVVTLAPCSVQVVP